MNEGFDDLQAHALSGVFTIEQLLKMYNHIDDVEEYLFGLGYTFADDDEDT